MEKEYDLVVAAVGLDNKSLSILKGANVKFQPPSTTKTYISEFHLGEKLVSEYFGDSMHVFLMNIPNLEFGALIPKGHYVTLVLLGKEISKELVQSFLSSPQVIGCFPKDYNLSKIACCQCYPKINTHTAKYMYGDRFVAIGDTATSKLYKNGIGAAYVTAKAAATERLPAATAAPRLTRGNRRSDHPPERRSAAETIKAATPREEPKRAAISSSAATPLPLNLPA